MTSATGSVLILGSLPMISARRMPASKTKAVSVLPCPFRWPSNIIIITCLSTGYFR